MFGLDVGFWIGMGIVAAVVVIGCAVAWGIPPKKQEVRPVEADMD